MRNKVLWIVVLLISVHLYQQQYDQKTTEVKVVIRKLNEDSQLKKEDIPKQRLPNKKISEQDQVFKQLKQELSLQQFSRDPFFEAVVASMLHFDCDSLNRYSRNNLSEKQRDVMSKFQIKCHQHKQNYPLLNKMLGEQNQVMIMKMALESPHTDLVQKLMSRKFMNDEQKGLVMIELIDKILSSENGHMIGLLSQIIKSDDAQQYIFQLSEAAGIFDHFYAEMVISRAFQLFSCQFNSGESCLGTGYYMVQQCDKYPQACGMDIQSWFELHHTVAHNRDIHKLIDLFMVKLQ